MKWLCEDGRVVCELFSLIIAESGLEIFGKGKISKLGKKVV